ncbi:N-acetylmuramoyl-L-alanine amidase [Sinanaerobacter chloroacetimidivorans]|uniref:N-acetylmuramoyl-L-alanine amidase n=1 Tax=Sinanaerobacter chloroacetimidivorans TaxID=2818044 RepID=A0A8J7W1C7_9FIRM|nr:N-acetylmuramoyl-L-alanine amidase [Sinanaerobacter chloroacetimidivorans]MBR0597778.1 N-acetylmuramoyl-L-alanine amidase [Sinanaerobacter chloroacetimidivorans]
MLVYLNPSTNEKNEFYGGGNEERYMNEIADAMVAYLGIAGIRFERNDPKDTLDTIIRKVNEKNFDLIISLYATDGGNDVQRGPDISYYAFSEQGSNLTYNISTELYVIHPLPMSISILPSVERPILTRTRAVSVIVDLGNSKSIEDAEWIRNNIYSIGRRLVFAIEHYFGLPEKLI